MTTECLQPKLFKVQSARSVARLGGKHMKITIGTCRVIIRRILGIVGVAAAGTGLVSLASGQVFAHQFLQEMTPGPNVGMMYSPELQLMVKPGTCRSGI